MGHVGLVLGLEMSRLARAGRDWHQLIELCSLAGALLVDADRGLRSQSGTTTRLALGDGQPASLPVDVIQRQGPAPSRARRPLTVTSGSKIPRNRALPQGVRPSTAPSTSPPPVREMDSGI